MTLWNMTSNLLILASVAFGTSNGLQASEDTEGCCIPGNVSMNESFDDIDLNQITFDDMVLYERSSCPYCKKVRRFMKKEGIEISSRNIKVPEYADELIEIGGKRQVPCLVIDGQALYESNEIIKFLQSVKDLDLS